MNILFLGIIFNKDEESKYLEYSKIGLQAASNIFQLNIIDGLTENIAKKKISVLSVLPVGSYPKKYRQFYLKTKLWTYNQIYFQEIGSINVFPFKQIKRYISINKRIEEWIKSSNDNRHIIVYSLYPIYIRSLRKIKKIYPEIKITVIVPDLPSIFGILSNNPLKAYFEKKIGNKVLKDLKIMDFFVLLTEKMKYPLDIKNKPFVVVEGLISEELQCENTIIKEEGTHCKSILYTGSLNVEFGIVELLDAFCSIEDNKFELWICGSGEASDLIEEKAKIDQRIKFYGYVSQAKVKELQNLATILINPRKNNGAYTKYSFPSKTMEYLASGKPVIMYKLDGIPIEYDQHLFYIEGESVESLKNKIIEVASIPNKTLQQQGVSAKKWIVSEKNSRIQAKKILDMLNIK